MVRESSDTIFLPDYVPMSESNVAVENSSYEISNLSGLGLRKKMYPSDLFQIHEEQTEAGWKYSVNDLATLDSEPLAPSWEVLVPKVSFALSKFSLAGNEGYF